MTQIIESLKWRYATKSFDSAKKLSDEQINNLLEAVRLSASSYGLQPWKLILVKNPELRTEIKGASWGQTQTTDASHLIVFAIIKDLSASHIDSLMNLVSRTRGVAIADLDGYKQMINSAIKSKMDQGGENAVRDWASKQAYIALGTLLTACALEKIDSCPMEGFDSKKVDEILKLEELGLESVLMCPVGFRSEDDKEANNAKVRFTKEEIVIVV